MHVKETSCNCNYLEQNRISIYLELQTISTNITRTNNNNKSDNDNSKNWVTATKFVYYEYMN